MVSSGCERTYMFRGKPIGEDRWIFGSLIVRGDEHYILTNGTSGKVDDCMMKVDPETVSQYVMGSDRNFTKIYEGDIVEVYGRQASWDDLPLRISVVVDRNTLIWEGGGYWKPQDTVQLEVVGNIWDNFELLDERTRGWIDGYYRRNLYVGEIPEV